MAAQLLHRQEPCGGALQERNQQGKAEFSKLILSLGKINVKGSMVGFKKMRKAVYL